MSSAFSLNNLIFESGAILSPVISGSMRDAYNSWVPPILLDGVLMVVAVILVLAIREPIAGYLKKGAAKSV